MPVYIVNGSTGEYSDHREWIVCGYAQHSMALLLVNRLTAAFQSVVAVLGGNPYQWSIGMRERVADLLREHDPHLELDYTGVHYYVTECELRDDVPEITLALEKLTADDASEEI
jgi:hypothetical protein